MKAQEETPLTAIAPEPEKVITETKPQQNIEELRVKADKVTMGDREKSEKLIELALEGNLFQPPF